MALTVALAGNAHVTRRLSTCESEGFLELVRLFRGANVAFAHLETLLHDFEGPEVYPAAEAGGMWVRSPRFVASELRWAGFDLVSLASNHALDYSYGGLLQTCAELDRIGMPHAGTGRDLAEARRPAYFDGAGARVALVSMTTSAAPWARAGSARHDATGRPGVNPLGVGYTVDAATRESLVAIAASIGWWAMRTGEREWTFNPPGLHNSVFRVIEDPQAGNAPFLDPDDVAGNLRAVRTAAEQADCVIVHIHSHEWHPAEGLSSPSPCLPPFARECIQAGADIVIAEGSHAPLRGIEIVEGKPVFYDPGDLFLMPTVDRQPMDLYQRYARDLPDVWTATPSEGLAARARGRREALSPPGGYMTGRVPGAVVPVCRFDAEMQLVEIEVHPATWATTPVAHSGIPHALHGPPALELLTYLQELCHPFSTELRIEGDIGVIANPDLVTAETSSDEVQRLTAAPGF